MSVHRSTAMIDAPSSARRTACERPWPRPAPVMKATLPSTSPMSDVLSSVFLSGSLRRAALAPRDRPGFPLRMGARIDPGAFLPSEAAVEDLLGLGAADRPGPPAFDLPPAVDPPELPPPGRDPPHPEPVLAP